MKTLIINIEKDSTTEHPKYRTKFKGKVSGTDITNTCGDIYIGTMLNVGFSKEEIKQRFTSRLNRVEELRINQSIK